MHGLSSLRRRISTVAATTILILILLVITACSSATAPKPAKEAATAALSPAPSVDFDKDVPMPGAEPDTTTDPYQTAQTDLEQLITSRAEWIVPPELDVDTSSAIGLKIGDSAEIRDAVARNLPSTQAQEAGTVTIGPNVTVRLEYNESQADVHPHDAIVSSTARNVAMLFSWNVTPRIPGELHVIAVVAVSLNNGPVLKTTELHKKLIVHRTLGYTAHQVFTNWGTWSAIVLAVLAMFRRTRELMLKPFGAMRKRTTTPGE
jgi:hypothetical protein